MPPGRTRRRPDVCDRRIILLMSASLDGFLARAPGEMDWRINALPKLVFSQTEPEFAWANARRSGRPVEEEIAERTRAADGDVVCFGGARFAHSLARHRLIDEYRLTVHPVALGEGLPLWHGLPEPQRFAPVAATAYPDGVVTHVLAAKTEGEN